MNVAFSLLFEHLKITLTYQLNRKNMYFASILIKHEPIWFANVTIQ